MAARRLNMNNKHSIESVLKTMKPFALTCALLTLLPVGVWAQTGQVTYTRTQKVNIDLPEEMAQFRQYIPEKVTTRYKMAFDGERASTTMAESGDTGVFQSSDLHVDGRQVDIQVGFSSTAGDRAGAPLLVQSFVDYAEGTRVEQRSFMDRQFLITDEIEELGWRLTGEEAEFLGRRVMKATAVQDTASVDAWFAPEIPVPLGPDSYSGLPGLILVLTVNDGDILIEADSVVLDVEVDLAKPDKGRKVTQAEFDSLVKEKLEDRAGESGRIETVIIRRVQ